MRFLLAGLWLAAAGASARAETPKVITLRIGNPVVSLSAADGPALPHPVVVIVEAKAEELRDSLNAMAKDESGRAFAVEERERWRCAARYEDGDGIAHFVKGRRTATLLAAARTAMSECRTAAGKAWWERCSLVKLGCRLGSPPPVKEPGPAPVN